MSVYFLIFYRDIRKRDKYSKPSLFQNRTSASISASFLMSRHVPDFVYCFLKCEYYTGKFKEIIM